jgi:hypothetical protein
MAARVFHRLTMDQQILCAAIAVFMLGLLARGLDAGERLSMVVTPARSMAPATIRVRVGVEPAASNRVLHVVADSGDYYRSSEIQLDGERAPRTLVVQFPSLPGGDYVVHSTLFDENGQQSASATEEIRVVPSAAERKD